LFQRHFPFQQAVLGLIHLSGIVTTISEARHHSDRSRYPVCFR
jgi:hypothetical protein